MKKFAIAGFIVALLASASVSQAEETPQMPLPQKEHEWLKQFVGEWESKCEIHMPDQPPMQCEGTESVRMLGGFWIVSQSNSQAMGMSFSSVLTLGYDPQREKYVGTWVDSMQDHMWQYEGTVDPTGKILTLRTEGPCCMDGGKIKQFKEVVEFKSPDHKTFTSSVQGEDGKWTTFVTVDYRRKK